MTVFHTSDQIISATCTQLLWSCDCCVVGDGVLDLSFVHELSAVPELYV